MKFPTLKTFARATFSQEEEYHWRQGLPFQPPAGFPRPWGAFAEYVARTRYKDIAELQNALEQALFHGVSAERPPRDRQRIVQALEIIAAYLSKQGLPGFLEAELSRFKSAVRDLDRGSVHFSLKPKAARSRRILGSDIWEARAHIALAMDLLLASGDTKSSASKKLAQSLGPAPEIIAPSSGNIASLIESWYNTFTNNACKDKDAQHLFDTRANYFEFLIKHHDTRDLRQISLKVMDHAHLLIIRCADHDAIKRVQAKYGGKGQRSRAPRASN